MVANKVIADGARLQIKLFQHTAGAQLQIKLSGARSWIKLFQHTAGAQLQIKLFQRTAGPGIPGGPSGPGGPGVPCMCVGGGRGGEGCQCMCVNVMYIHTLMQRCYHTFVIMCSIINYVILFWRGGGGGGWMLNMHMILISAPPKNGYC